MKGPFLWEFVKESPLSDAQSGGQEKPFTASLAEENAHAVVRFNG